MQRGKIKVCCHTDTTTATYQVERQLQPMDWYFTHDRIENNVLKFTLDA